jgi:hypothetical protein
MHHVESSPGKRLALLFLAIAPMFISGCKSIGPGSIPRDRFDYGTSMTESWKRQTLLNIVKLRYLDPPAFVDVGQIVAGYSLETGLEAGAQFARPNAGDTFGAVGGHVVFTDRPTITYTPLTGSRFVRGLMTPIPPESLFFTIQSGWPADVILKVGASAINGLRNEEISINSYRPPDTNFVRAAELLRKIQVSGAVGMKIVQDKDKRETKMITFRSQSVPSELLRDIMEFRKLMGMDPDATEFQLVFGASASSDREVAMQTRSLLHILGLIAARADVPAEDIQSGRAAPGIGSVAENSVPQPSLRIRASEEKPKDAFVAVEYRDHWFWIDDRDLVSKRDFSFMMLLFTLADTGEKESLPLITIPAQ